MHVPQLGRNSFSADSGSIVIPALTPRERRHEAAVAALDSARRARESVKADEAMATDSLVTITNALRARFVKVPPR